MGEIFSSILPKHEDFIRKQKLFFVGSAPLSESGHVNISPKGHDVFRIFSPNEVAYLDLTGSGNETSAHVMENERITFMFVSFEGPPMILRLYGKARVILPETDDWDDLAQHFDLLPGTRQIIYANIETVKTSCGYSIPFYTYNGERNTLQNWANKKGEEELEEYRKKKNSYSMDGIVTPIGEVKE